MRTLLVDGHNFLHRSRSGFNAGEFPVVYNFFRGFRALVEKIDPNRIVFVMEGHPKARHALLPEYKANREVEQGSKEHQALQEFFRQVKVITGLLETRFPVSVVHHPDHECDDVIANIIRRGSRAVEYVIASNDSDFIQLLDTENVSIYNPMKKGYVAGPDYDYVTWKALRGDGSDNIPGIPGIGDVGAATLVNDPSALKTFLSNKQHAEIFSRNYELIKFVEWSDEEALGMTCSEPTRDWDDVKSSFRSFGFRSMLEEPAWGKFVGTFDHMFGDG